MTAEQTLDSLMSISDLGAQLHVAMGLVFKSSAEFLLLRAQLSRY